MEELDLLKDWKKVFTIGFLALLAMNIVSNIIAGFCLNRLEEKLRLQKNRKIWIWAGVILLIGIVGSLVYVGIQQTKKPNK